MVVFKFIIDHNSFILHIQMVMLYRGTDDKTFHSSSAPAGVSINSKQTTESVNMPSLKDELCQRDNQINILKSELAMLKVKWTLKRCLTSFMFTYSQLHSIAGTILKD